MTFKLWLFLGYVAKGKQQQFYLFFFVLYTGLANKVSGYICEEIRDADSRAAQTNCACCSTSNTFGMERLYLRIPSFRKAH